VTGPNNAVTSTEVTLTVTTVTVPSTPQLSFNFNDGNVPTGTAVFGNATVTANGGVGDSGTLHLIDAINNENGAFVIPDPDAGAPVYGFTAHFQTLVGGGTTPPADGFAFAFGNDIPADPTAGAPHIEDGVGLNTNLLVTFDIYNNDTIFGVSNPSEAQPALSIDVRFGGQVIATRQFPVSFMESGAQYGDTIIQLNNDATLTVVYRGVLVFDHLLISAFGSISGGSFALVARSGGLNENVWVDNFGLTTVTTPGPARITSQPVSQTILVNHAVTFALGVNDTNGVTYQWLRGGSPISGQTADSYTIASVSTTDNGAIFSVQATKSSIAVTSAPATLTVANLTAPASPQFSFNFDDGLAPAGTGVYPNSYVTAVGGVSGSGCLHLTDAVNSQNGAFVVSNLVVNGAQVNAISVAFDVREGGGSGNPADGFSFNWASGLTDGVVGSAETGTGNGVSLCFRRYTGNGNADNPPSPYIGIKYKGTFIATTQIPGAQLDTDTTNGPTYRTMLFRVDSDGKAYLAYGERVLYNGLQLPNYTFVANSKFGIYGRTGGENNNQWFDNVKIQATQGSGPLTVTTQPADVTVIAGHTANFTVALSDPNNATYQWQKNGGNISGATTTSYTTPATTTGDNGALFKVTATGPSGTVISSNALLTVVAPITISNPTASYDFNDCAVPPGTILNGSGQGNGNGGYIVCSGGVGDSGCLHLTDAANGEGGTFIIPDLNTNMPVKAFTAYFAAQIGGGSFPPADGFSLSWTSASEVPANLVTGEGGGGSGLIVVFNLYNGGNPYFGITYHGTVLATKYVPYTAMETGGNFADTFIRVNANGTVDVQFNGNVIFNQVALPGYVAVVGNEFVLGARTGGLNENQWVDNIQIATTPGLLPVPLQFRVSGTNLRLSWSGDGFKLQSTASLAPPVTWSDVLGAASPYLVPTTNAAAFYRLAPAP
jgi:hypothetical protein